MKKRDFLKTSAIAASSVFLPKSLMSHEESSKKLRTAHIGVGGMGFEDLKAISSHKNVEIIGFCLKILGIVLKHVWNCFELLGYIVYSTIEYCIVQQSTT